MPSGGAFANSSLANLFGKKLHGFVGQNPARDGDRGERSLGGDLRARDHDLIDFSGELLHGSGKDQPADMAPVIIAPMHIAHGSPDV